MINRTRDTVNFVHGSVFAVLEVFSHCATCTLDVTLSTSAQQRTRHIEYHHKDIVMYLISRDWNASPIVK